MTFNNLGTIFNHYHFLISAILKFIPFKHIDILISTVLQLSQTDMCISVTFIVVRTSIRTFHRTGLREAISQLLLTR